jgi:hypothetical protein
MALSPSNPHRPAVTRAALPEVLWPGDLVHALGVATERAAVRMVLRQRIPHGRLGRRIYVRREALLGWLEAAEGGAAATRRAPRLLPPTQNRGEGGQP